MTLPFLTEQKLIKISITAQEVQGLIKSLNSKKITSPGEIPEFFLKNIGPELSLILAKLFIRCLK